MSEYRAQCQHSADLFPGDASTETISQAWGEPVATFPTDHPEAETAKP